MNNKTEKRTKSELLFEEYLVFNGYPDFEFEPDIPGQPAKPDYAVTQKGETGYFEVKELYEKEPPLKTEHYYPYSAFRSKIQNSRKKFKALKDFCCSLVIYNISNWQSRLRPQEVFGVMLGDLGFTLKLDTETGAADIESIGSVFLDDGKMVHPHTGKPQNTTFSAIILLEKYRVWDTDFLARKKDKIRYQETLKGRKLSGEEKVYITVDLFETSPPDNKTVPRVIVVKNPDARNPFPENMFTGPYDEHWKLVDGIITRCFAGKRLVAYEAIANTGEDSLEF